MTSAEKPFYQSKKFTAFALSVLALIVSRYLPEHKSFTDQLLILVMTYIGGQSAVDITNELKK